MLSTIKIDIDHHRQEHISIKWSPSDDPRDKLIAYFLQSACPEGITLDGYARVTILGKNMDSGYSFEIHPIHPLDMPSHIELIHSNANKIPHSSEPALIL